MFRRSHRRGLFTVKKRQECFGDGQRRALGSQAQGSQAGASHGAPVQNPAGDPAAGTGG